MITGHNKRKGIEKKVRSNNKRRKKRGLDIRKKKSQQAARGERDWT